MMNILLSGGVTALMDWLLSSWIGPIFFVVVAAVSITFLINRQFRMLWQFVAIAAVIGLLIFAGPWLFGSDGVFTNVGKDAGEKIGNFIQLGKLMILNR